MEVRNRRFAGTAIMLLALAGSAVAEVMDKEPTVPQIWQGAAIMIPIAFIVRRLLPQIGLGLIFFPNPAVSALDDVNDRYVGPAIMREAGSSYLWQVGAANAFWIVAYLIGIALWLRARRAETRPRTTEYVTTPEDARRSLQDPPPALGGRCPSRGGGGWRERHATDSSPQTPSSSSLRKDEEGAFVAGFGTSPSVTS